MNLAQSLKKATRMDLSISITYNLPNDIEIKIIPNTDIIDLQLKLNYLDSFNNIIKSEYLNFEDVQKNQEIKNKIYLNSDFLKQTTQCNVEVINGMIYTPIEYNPQKPTKSKSPLSAMLIILLIIASFAIPTHRLYPKSFGIKYTSD